MANAAPHAIGCLAKRACHTDRCPLGIATQDPRSRARLPIEEAGERLARFRRSSAELMVVLARACGRRRLADLHGGDLTTFDRDLALLSGVSYGGVTPVASSSGPSR